MAAGPWGLLARTLLSQRTVLVYMLAPVSDAEPNSHDGSYVKRRFCHIWGGLRGYLSVLLSPVVLGVSRGGGAAGCSDLRTPQAPPPHTVPDAQMGQTVSLSASGAGGGD